MAPPTEIMTFEAPEAYYSDGLRSRFRLQAFNTDPVPIVTEGPAAVYADMGYEIDEAGYLARAKKRVEAGGLETSLPAGFPAKLDGPLIWHGKDLQDEKNYVLQLTDADKEELGQAFLTFEEHGLDGHEVGRDNFPLPKLGKRLDDASREIYQGKGFVVVRGLNPDDFSPEDFAVMYLGVSSYIAERRGKQDQKGSMLMHAMAKDKDDLKTHDKPFHTDTVCDCLALVTRNCSAKGGRSIISSAWTVYNELAATRPDLLHVLAKDDWPFDTYGRDPPYYRRAVLYYHDGKMIFNLSRVLLVGHAPKFPRTPGIPGLNEAQAEALDAVHFIAEKYEIRAPMLKGDMRFFNNMGILHRREAFTNEGDNNRHLVRLWLNNQQRCWALPAPLQLAWARVFDDEERGCHWDIEPPRRNGVILKVAGSCD